MELDTPFSGRNAFPGQELGFAVTAMGGAVIGHQESNRRVLLLQPQERRR